MEENKIENKQSGWLKYLCIVLCVLILVIAGLVIYTKLSDNDKEDNKTNNTEEKVNKDEEKDITSKANIEKYNEIVDIVENTYLKDDNEKSKLYTLYSKDEVTIKDLNKNSIYAAVFTKNLNMFEEIDDSDKLKENYDNYADSKKLIEKTKNVFGNDIPEITTNIGGCPSFTYDKKSGTIYAAMRCGFGPGPYTQSKIDKITEKGNNIYVYIYVASFEPNEKDSYETTTIYSDPELTKKYKTVKDEESDKVFESNYKDFSPYKYTFTKNSDGYYIFEKLEKVK